MINDIHDYISDCHEQHDHEYHGDNVCMVPPSRDSIFGPNCGIVDILVSLYRFQSCNLKIGNCAGLSLPKICLAKLGCVPSKQFEIALQSSSSEKAKKFASDENF